MNESTSLLTFQDLFGLPIILVLLFLIIKLVVPFYIQEDKLLRYFYFGLFLKVAGVVASLLFYSFVESRGDTHGYFVYAKIISKYIAENNFEDYIKLFFTDFEDLPFEIKSQLPIRSVFSQAFEGNKLIILITATTCFFTFNSYLAVSLLFSFFAFIGTWLIFLRLTKYYPELFSTFYIFIICWPSIVFFASGVLKEPLCIGAMGIIFYILFGEKNMLVKKIQNFIILIVMCIALYHIKPYLLVSMVVAYIVSIILGVVASIISKELRTFIYLVMIASLLAFLISVSFFWNYFLTWLPIQDLYEAILRTTKAQLTLGNSKYDLGELKLTPLGITSYLASSLNVSLFRPYPFEINKAQLLISGLESLVMLIMFMVILIKVGLIRMFFAMKSSPILAFMFVYFCFVGVQIGAISFNFGTLVRYKMPLVPFYFAFAFVLLKHYSKDKKKLT